MTHTVGHRLRIARESKGLSLQDVAHQTRIPVPRLRDLEEDTYTTFGSLTYARTFLKDYSQRMGVDAHEVLEEMHSPPLGSSQDYKYLVQNYGTWTKNRRSSSYENPPMMAKGRSMGLVAALCGAVLLVGMGVLLGAAFIGEHKQGPPPPIPPLAEEVRAAKPAPLPETQAASFASTPLEQEAQQAPRALPAGTEKSQGTPFKKPQLAPGVIPKALPVDEPKTKPKR